MHRPNRTHCFWQATDPTAPGRSIFHRADLNLPGDPLSAEENTAFQNYPTGRAMPPIQHKARFSRASNNAVPLRARSECGQARQARSSVSF